MFGERLRRAKRIARRRYARLVAPYLLWNVRGGLPGDFDPYRRSRGWPKPVGFYRDFNGAHGRWCCTRPHLKEKGWRKRRFLVLRALNEPVDRGPVDRAP
jgi:hypothetical protein